MLQLFLFWLLLGSADAFSINAFEENEESSGDKGPGKNLTVTARLTKANKNLGKRGFGPRLRELDIAVGYGLQNADPCTASFCRWPKSRDGNVYVPYWISKRYSQGQKKVIEDGLRSFSRPLNSGPITCIRFVLRTQQPNFLHIQSLDGCFSDVGMQEGRQTVSLDREDCMSRSTIQHELLHALGFEHEHSRSDRDQHVKILWQNVRSGLEYNFEEVQTNNLGTRYDYKSVMQYERNAFSINDEPTMLPIPDSNVAMGLAEEMSDNDILRINRLYQCTKQLEAMGMEVNEE